MTPRKPSRMIKPTEQDNTIPRDYNITLLISLVITISSIFIVVIGFLYNSFVNTQYKRINALEERILKLEELLSLQFGDQPLNLQGSLDE